jgi:hypothetical protein
MAAPSSAGVLGCSPPGLHPAQSRLGLPEHRLGRHGAPRPTVHRDRVPLAHELVELEHVTPSLRSELDVVQDHEQVVRVREEGDVEPQEPVVPFEDGRDLLQVARLDARHLRTSPRS